MALNELLHRRRPTRWQQCLKKPGNVLIDMLYAYRQRMGFLSIEQKLKLGLRVVCISDTHNMVIELPPGDLLIHAGDLTQGGTAKELQAQLDWINAQPCTHKIVVAGNHDLVLDREKDTESGMQNSDREQLRWGSILYLQNSACELDLDIGVRMTIFGSPMTRKHGNWAFQYTRGTNCFYPLDIDHYDILVTHSPPQHHLDVAGWGDEYLLQELWRVRPRLHVFGHVHGGHGRDNLCYDTFERLYEQTRGQRESWIALIKMAFVLLWMSFFSLSRDHVQYTELVNASMVGGMLDEQLRKPIVVYI